MSKVIVCPICNSKKCVEIVEIPYTFRNNKFFVKIKKCLLCECEFLSPFPSDKLLNDIYQEIYQQEIHQIQQDNKNKGSEKYFKKLKMIIKECLPDFLIKILLLPSTFLTIQYHNVIYKFVKNKKISVIDIGCGNGWFLESLINKSSLFNIDHCLGFDFSENANKLCRAKNIPVINDLGQVKEKFDLIVCIHFIEHCKTPRQFVKKISEIISDDGWVFLALPNISGLGRKIKKFSWEGYNPPKHVINYNKKALKALFVPEGFQLVYYRTSDFYSGKNSFFANYLLKFILLIFVKLFNIGDEQVACFKKIK